MDLESTVRQLPLFSWRQGCFSASYLMTLNTRPSQMKTLPPARDKTGGLRDGASRRHADDCEFPVIPAE